MHLTKNNESRDENVFKMSTGVNFRLIISGKSSVIESDYNYPPFGINKMVMRLSGRRHRLAQNIRPFIEMTLNDVILIVLCQSIMNKSVISEVR